MDFDLACPICQTTKFTITQPNGSPVGDMHCPRCRRHFSNTGAAVDLTLTSGVPPGAYEQRSWAGTELFRSPLVSLAYERGWRQSFAWAGFPGVDKEADIAMTYLAPAYGDVVVDMSCGSGLFSRKFLGSGRFKGVIAADFSESMVQEARSFFDQDRGIDSR